MCPGTSFWRPSESPWWRFVGSWFQTSGSIERSSSWFDTSPGLSCSESVYFGFGWPMRRRSSPCPWWSRRLPTSGWCGFWLLEFVGIRRTFWRVCLSSIECSCRRTHRPLKKPLTLYALHVWFQGSSQAKSGRGDKLMFRQLAPCIQVKSPESLLMLHRKRISDLDRVKAPDGVFGDRVCLLCFCPSMVKSVRWCYKKRVYVHICVTVFLPFFHLKIDGYEIVGLKVNKCYLSIVFLFYLN